MKRFLMMFLVALVATLGIAACGDDDEGDLTAYCDLAAELDQQEDFPSDEQLNEIEDVAPTEIRDEVELVAERFRDANDDPETLEQVFEDPEVQEAFGEIEAFEDENCPARDAEDEGDDEGEDVEDTTTTEAEETTTTEEEVEDEAEDETTTTVDDMTEDETTETTTTE